MNSIVRKCLNAVLLVSALAAGPVWADATSSMTTRRGGDVPMKKASDIDAALEGYAVPRDGIPVKHTYETREEGGRKQVRQVSARKPAAKR